MGKRLSYLDIAKRKYLNKLYAQRIHVLLRLGDNFIFLGCFYRPKYGVQPGFLKWWFLAGGGYHINMGMLVRTCAWQRYSWENIA